MSSVLVLIVIRRAGMVEDAPHHVMTTTNAGLAATGRAKSSTSGRLDLINTRGPEPAHRIRTQREESFMRRALQLGLSVLSVSVLLLATAGTSSAQVAGTDAMGVKGAHAAHHRGSTLLSSHGGAIETAPVVFITYWGASWSTGFSTGAYTSVQAQNYVQSFFTNVGGSSRSNSTTHYC